MTYEIIFTEGKTRSALFPRIFRTKEGALAALAKHAEVRPWHAKNLSVRRVPKK